MKNYKIKYEVTNEYTLIVEAEDEKEAESLVELCRNDGMEGDWEGTNALNILNVEETDTKPNYFV